MREEDEIRAAVIALAEAQAAGEDVSDELPHGEVAVEAAEASLFGDGMSAEEQRGAAIALVLDAVRAATREGRLAQPGEWEAAGLVPPAMTAEDLEMAVYDALMEHGEPVPEGARATGEGAKAGPSDATASPRHIVNRHVKSAFSSSNGRPVGAMGFKAHKAADGGREGGLKAAPTVSADPAVSEDPVGDGALLRNPAVSVGPAVSEDPVGDGLSRPVPGGAVDRGREGGLKPAPTEATPAEAASAEESSGADFSDIRLLMGKVSYYLYDASAMTDAYARWSFLAAEADPVATFVECVREESSVYPRPMALTNLANEPFRMDAAAVEAVFAEARAQGRADDIERTEASNGDVYFYSTTYLSPARAKALAEWDAVERKRNV